MRSVMALVAGVMVIVSPVSVAGWGMDVHRLITARALDGLPSDLRPLFAARRDFVIEHSVDPDLWRVVGLLGEHGAEDPNHFLDIDGLDEPPPFAGVPREWDAYVARYGTEKANRMGRLPWRVADVYGRLLAAFRDMGTGRSPWAADNARYLSAVLAHYVEDAHQPFHAALNYDGQLTGQRGIHSRFETELVLRNRTSLRLSPVRIRPIANARDDIFARLVEGQALVAPILDADRRASGGRERYDDAYYAAFLDGVRPILERRLSESASGVASMIVAAWTEAGRPAVSRAPSPPGLWPH
ncbi:MAG: hypothetical protein R2752_12565 [Vicinamibacterales bacterium]